MYRINIFNTTSRVDANGRQLDEFINVDLPAIFNRLLTVKDTKKLNEQIRNRCKDFLRSADVTVQDKLCDNVSDTNDVVCTNDKIAKGSSSKDAKTASHSENVVLALKNVNNPTTENTNRSCNEPTASDKNVSYIQKQSINVLVASESKTKPTIRSNPVSNHVHPRAVSSVKTASRSETDVLVLRSTNVPTSYSSVKSTNMSSTEPTANDKNVSYIQKQCHKVPSEVNKAKPTNRSKPVSSTCSVPISAVSSVNHSIAVDLLHEEGDKLCVVCDTLGQDKVDMCELCSNVCHVKCSRTDVESDTFMCLSCVGRREQDSVRSDIAQKGTQKELGMVNTDNQHCSGSSEESVTQATQTRTTKKDDKVETTNIKMKDLRQKELKLKKWEEDLKIREAQLTNTENERIRLQTYVSKLEARNKELEQTLRIYKRVSGEIVPRRNRTQEKSYPT